MVPDLLVKWSNSTGVGLGGVAAGSGRVHVADGLVGTRDVESLVLDVANSLTVPVATFLERGNTTVCADGSGRGHDECGGILHLVVKVLSCFYELIVSPKI